MKSSKEQVKRGEFPLVSVRMQPKRMSEKIYEQIFDWIMDGTLQSGDRLIETEIAESFGVSRIPIREAIQMLEAKGLVDSAPYLGVTVKSFSMEEIADIYRLRQLLESFACKEAALKITSAELQELQGQLEVLRKSINAGLEPSLETTKYLYQQNKNFHMTMYQGAKMPKLVQLICDLWDSIAFFRIKIVKGQGYAQQMLDEHTYYLHCLENRLGEELSLACSNNLQKHIDDFNDKNSSNNLHTST